MSDDAQRQLAQRRLLRFERNIQSVAAAMGETDPATIARLALGLSSHAALAPGTAALIIGDAGAARGRADIGRVLDSLAFVKALRRRAASVVWLNPVPRPLWADTVAARIARHVPMFVLDRAGIHLAVNALRGHFVNLERPL